VLARIRLRTLVGKIVVALTGGNILRYKNTESKPVRGDFSSERLPEQDS
jgi:hypothetical protein